MDVPRETRLVQGKLLQLEGLGLKVALTVLLLRPQLIKLFDQIGVLKRALFYVAAGLAICLHGCLAESGYGFLHVAQLAV